MKERIRIQRRPLKPRRRSVRQTDSSIATPLDGKRTGERVAEQQGEIKRLRREMLEAREAFDDFFNLAPVCFLTLDDSGRILEANSTAAELLGFSPSWLFGKSFVVFVATDCLPLYMQHLKQCGQTRRTTVDVRLNIVGRELHVRILSVLLAGNQRERYRTAILDITEMTKAERRSAEFSADWLSLVRNAPDIILKVDRHGQITFSNRPFRGFRSAGRTIFQIFPAAARAALRQCLRDAFRGQSASCEIETETEAETDRDTETETASNRWYNLQFGAVQDGPEGARVDATTVIIRDVTGEKRRQLQLAATTEQMRKLSARIESVREEERVRLAREIHDELGQALTVLKMDLSWLQRQPGGNDGSRARIDRMIEFTDRTIGTVRRIASELRPAILDDLGLLAAIEWQLEDFQRRSGIRCRFKGSKRSIAISQEQATAVFRVVQEALTNIARHSEATQVVVEVGVEKQKLVVNISDNGRGIRKSAVQNRASLGLIGMRERITQLGGRLEISGKSGAGTRLSFQLPLS